MKNENMTRPIVMTYIRALPILSPTEDKPSNSVLQTLKPLSSSLLGSMTSPFTGTFAAVRPAYWKDTMIAWLMSFQYIMINRKAPSFMIFEIIWLIFISPSYRAHVEQRSMMARTPTKALAWGMRLSIPVILASWKNFSISFRICVFPKSMIPPLYHSKCRCPLYGS